MTPEEVVAEVEATKDPAPVMITHTTPDTISTFLRLLTVAVVALFIFLCFQSFVIWQQRTALNQANDTIAILTSRSADAERLFDSVRDLTISGLLAIPNRTPDQERILRDLEQQKQDRERELAAQKRPRVASTTSSPKARGSEPRTTSTSLPSSTNPNPGTPPPPTTRPTPTTTTTTTTVPGPVPSVPPGVLPTLPVVPLPCFSLLPC